MPNSRDVGMMKTIRGMVATEGREAYTADRTSLIPTGVLEVPCPAGLHRATCERLVREYNRLIDKLRELPRRSLWPHIRLAYQRQFENRIIRIRRVLRLSTPHPRPKSSYRTSEAALFLGISSKTRNARSCVRNDGAKGWESVW